MGFPVAYTDLFFQKHLLHIINLLRNLISSLFCFIQFQSPSPQPRPLSFSAVLLRQLLPVVKFSELLDPPESCVVCLYEFDADDEIRVLSNCTHVFHGCCLERWMDHDRKTCPLCRTPLMPEDLQDSLNERLWTASGISDYSSLVGWSSS